MIGHYACVIIANHLYGNIPHLVVVVHPRCNMFDANFVHQQWENIEDLWKKYVEHFLGPVISHSLDGDNRRRMLMLKYYYSMTDMRYQIPWEGWKLIGLYDGFKVT